MHRSMLDTTLQDKVHLLCLFELRMTQHEDEVYPVFLFQEHLGCLNSGRDMCFEIPLKVAARVDIKISVISDASNANAVCVGGFMGWYQPIN